MAAEGSPQAKSRGHRKVLGACVFLVAITWLVFGQTLRYGFVNYDDSEYVYANPTIASGIALLRMKSICRSKISSGSLSKPTMKPAITSIP